MIHTAELDRPEYRANPSNRCYYCKDELYGRLADVRRRARLEVIVDGNNADDRGDYRPGRQAAREHGVKSPLDEADLTKDDIRELAREAGLNSWNEPASACLSSRIPYGTKCPTKCCGRSNRPKTCCATWVSASFESGITTRWRGSRSPEPRWRALSIPTSMRGLIAALKALGYQYVSLDLQGYRLGSLNEALRLRPVS